MIHFTIIDFKIGISDDNIQFWAKHKMNQSIRCGLNQAYSEIAIEDWQRMSHQTNTAESNHNRGYRFSGRYLPILTCILKNAELDQLSITQSDIFSTFGMESSYRAVSHESRMARQITKTSKLYYYYSMIHRRLIPDRSLLDTLRFQQLEGQSRALMPPPITATWPVPSSMTPSINEMPSSPQNSLMSTTDRSVDDQLLEEIRSNASATSSGSRASKRCVLNLKINRQSINN